MGTLGSGNHFLELQVVDRVVDERAAKAFGIREGQITAMIHTGSRVGAPSVLRPCSKY